MKGSLTTFTRDSKPLSYNSILLRYFFTSTRYAILIHFSMNLGLLPGTMSFSNSNKQKQIIRVLFVIICDCHQIYQLLIIRMTKCHMFLNLICCYL